MSLLQKIKSSVEGAKNGWNGTTPANPVTTNEMHEQAEIPLGFKKGEAFQQYAKKVLFPDPPYILFAETPSYQQTTERRNLGALNPDFQFRCISNNIIFWVEAKWRQRLYENKFKVWENGKGKQYHAVNNDYPLLILAGLGGSPSAPESVYLIPFRDMDYPSYYFNAMQKYQIELARMVPQNRIQELCNHVS